MNNNENTRVQRSDILEYFKKKLSEMIAEGRGLPAAEVGGIPNTSIIVKIGRENEFAEMARNYYEAKYNQFAIGNYLEEVYQELLKEQDRELEENREDEIAEAASWYVSNNDDVVRLEQFQKSLQINRDDRAKFEKALNEGNIHDANSWAQRANIRSTLNSLEASEREIINNIAAIKDRINAKTRTFLENELERVRKNYQDAKYGSERGFGKNGVAVLAQDVQLYDNLCDLYNILNKVDEKETIICVDNVVCVNPDKEALVKQCLANINTLNLMAKKEEPIKEEPVQEESLEKKANKAILTAISEELERLKEIGSPEANAEYDKLTRVAKYLNKANESKYTLVPVWNAYVDSYYRYAFENLIKDTVFFQKYNPELKQIEAKEEQIKELENRLVAIENKVKEYNGLFNPDLIKIGEAIILSDDKEEYKSILDKINELRASMPKIDIKQEIKTLANTPGSTPGGPGTAGASEVDFRINDEWVNTLEGNLADYYDNPYYGSLSSDVKNIQDILNKAKSANNLVSLSSLNVNRYNGVVVDFGSTLQISADDLEQFKEMVSKVYSCLRRNTSAVAWKILDRMHEDLELTPEEERENNLLIRQQEILRQVTFATSVKIGRGILVPTAEYDEYMQIVEELEQIEKSRSHTPPKKTEKVDFRINDELIKTLGDYKDNYNDSIHASDIKNIQDILNKAKSANNLVSLNSLNVNRSSRDVVIDFGGTLQIPADDLEQFKEMFSRVYSHLREQTGLVATNVSVQILNGLYKDLELTPEEERKNNLLARQREILNHVTDATSVKIGRGILIPTAEYDEYMQIVEELEQIEKSRSHTPPKTPEKVDFRINDEWVNTLEGVRQKVIDEKLDFNVTLDVKKKITDIQDILNKAKLVNNLVGLDSLNIYEGKTLNFGGTLQIPADDLEQFKEKIIWIYNFLRMEPNRKKIEEIKARMSTLMNGDATKIMPEEAREYNLLKSQKDILEQAMDATALKEESGLLIPTAKYDEYGQIVKELEQLEQQRNNQVDLSANEELMATIRMKMGNLSDMKFNLDNVDQENMSEYVLLEKQYEILKSAKPNSDLTLVGRAYVPADRVEEYWQIVDRLAAVYARKNATDDDLADDFEDDFGKGTEDDNYDFKKLKKEKHRIEKIRKSKRSIPKTAVYGIVGVGLTFQLTPSLLVSLAAAGITPLGLVGGIAVLAGARKIWKKYQKGEEINLDSVKGVVNNILNKVSELQTEWERKKAERDEEDRTYELNDSLSNPYADANRQMIDYQIAEGADLNKYRKMTPEEAEEVPDLDEIVNGTYMR